MAQPKIKGNVLDLTGADGSGISNVDATTLGGVVAAGYSQTNHNHNSVYAPLVHNHNSVYAPLVHDHNSVYAPLIHNHATSDINNFSNDVQTIVNGMSGLTLTTQILDGVTSADGLVSTSISYITTSHSGYAVIGDLNVNDIVIVHGTCHANGFDRPVTIQTFALQGGIEGDPVATDPLFPEYTGGQTVAAFERKDISGGNIIPSGGHGFHTFHATYRITSISNGTALVPSWTAFCSCNDFGQVAQLGDLDIQSYYTVIRLV